MASKGAAKASSKPQAKPAAAPAAKPGGRLKASAAAKPGLPAAAARRQLRLTIQKPRVYTEEEIASMRLQFQMIDTDGNQVLDPDEMAAFARLYSIDPNFVSLAFLLFDSRDTGGLTFDDFLQFMDFTRSFDKDPRSFYRRLFDAIDRDHNGTLSPAELREFYSLMGSEISEGEATRIINSMDLTGTGNVIFDDLCLWLGLPRHR
jgi:Ca2+-binding EF-hand superfamily protein